MSMCKTIGCGNQAGNGQDYCCDCREVIEDAQQLAAEREQSMSERYPKYYKSVAHLDEIDVYAVHHLFNIQDPAGAIQHASKKLLLSGVRTGGKSAFDDVREARDTLTRWLQLNAEM